MRAIDREIPETVIRLVREQLDLEPGTTITAESNFYNDLGGDSLDMAELVMDLEERYDINAPEPERAPQTLGEIAALVEACLSAEGTGVGGA